MTDKIAADLQQVIAAPTTPTLSWAKDVNGMRMVKVLVVANSTDPDLTALRSDVLAKGGSVYFRYVSVAALSAMLPANQVAAIAARSDVQGISPNRLTARTASTLEYATGALTSNVRTYSSATTYTGLDGTGVGIAVLDSGIEQLQQRDDRRRRGASRVKRAVDFQKVGDATARGRQGLDRRRRRLGRRCIRAARRWPTYESNIDSTGASSRPTSTAMASHVAIVAAGRGYYQATDSTGVAPNANLYDVKVLDANGYGQMSDVLAGIDWVIYHAKEYNIRVMNLSLAADSTESWQTDPLARAARSAVAAGITVVVAAGNFGQNAQRRRALRHDQLARARPVGDHRRLGQHQGHGAAQRRHGQPVQLARPDPRLVHRRHRRAPHRQPAQARPGGAGQQDRRRAGRPTRPARRLAGTTWPTTYTVLSQRPARARQAGKTH